MAGPDKLSVQILQTGDRYFCGRDETLLRAMMRIGKCAIPVGCLNGGCGVCKVRVLEGEVAQIAPLSRAHVSADEQACGFTLACRVTPRSNVTLSLAGPLHSRLTASPLRGARSIT